MQKKDLDFLSDKLSPIDIKNKEFRRTVWGYSPQEVVDFLDIVARTWEKVQKHEKQLIEEIRILNGDLDRWKAKEQELTRLKLEAEKDAEGIRDRSMKEAEMLFVEVKKQADEMRAKTEDWLASIISEVEVTEKRRDDFVRAFKSTLDEHYALLQTTQGEEPQLGSVLEKFLKHRSQGSKHNSSPELPGSELEAIRPTEH